MNKSDSSIKVELVDDKKIEKGNLPDRSIKAYVNKTELNGLVDGQGGESMIVNLDDYMDLETFILTDVEGAKEVINAGKVFYLNLGGEGTGLVLDGFYSGVIDGDQIIISSTSLFTEQSDGGDGGLLLGVKFYFDATTGILDYTKPITNVFLFAHTTEESLNRIFTLGKLSIISGKDTYEYDGSQDVDIDISSGSGGGGQYVLELYADLSTSSTIELSSEDDGTVSDAMLFGVNVEDFIDFATHTGTPYLHHNILSSYNLVVIASDAVANVDTYSSSVASVFARDSGETDPETGDPIQEFGILFTAYDSTNSRFKEYEGVLTESGGVWSITISEA